MERIPGTGLVSAARLGPADLIIFPRSAVNWTEMWQAETFDAATIDQEPGLGT
ncbi:Uncharacterised protein [Kluyvera cryocrescens]|uniref:Uncharacterized protein n=1 Tax=Kluyvera cryocrescens TaxID=580 RepID=A0A485D3U4_KLUCR|nr:Uncharacterised protein [Kluyvera cryocrescens]